MRRRFMRYLLVFIAAAVSVQAAWASGPARPEDRERLPGIAGLDARAVVVLGYYDRGRGTASVRWPRVAFAIGDGTLLLTAAHCVDDLLDPSARPVSPEAVVISPYYGDAFGFEIVAVDLKADLAVLQAHWPAHPALALAAETESTTAEKLLIVSRPSVRQDEPYHLGRDVRTELLAVIGAEAKRPSQAVQLEGAQQITHGWSGSAIVIPSTGRVAGVLGQINRKTVRRAVFFRIPRVDALGCSVRSVHKLLREHGLEGIAARPAPSLETIPNGKLGFSLAMDYLEALLNKDTPQAIRVARELVGLRPESVRAHLMLAHGAAVAALDANAPLEESRTLAESSFEKALQVDPNSAHAHAAYANFLLDCGRDSEALARVELALSMDPNDPLTQVNRLILLGKIDPGRARAAGEQAVASDPNNPYLWFYHSSTLLKLDQAEQALDAAQRAVDLDPNGLFYSPLADALTALDRLDEAEKHYEHMTQRCACQQCWYKYALFLVHRRKHRLSEATHALEMAEAKAASNRIASRRMIRLKLQLLEKTSPQEAERVARRLLEDSPEDAEYWWYLATILRTQGKHAEAVQAARKAVELNPEERYRPRLANCLGRAGDLDAAQNTYDEMLERHPERPLYWYWYAEFLLDYYTERLDEARAALDRAASPSDSGWAVPAEDLHKLRQQLEPEPVAQ
ncbi:MAG: tetratricopeptide repeat protein [Planctomycetota bacterium]